MEKYEVVRAIGSGSYGQVYLVTHKIERKQYVMKKIKTRNMSQKEREATELEVRLLQKLRHPNIVAYKDSFIDREQQLCIVMVYCEGGDLFSKVRGSRGVLFKEKQILDWFVQMTLALHYLHERKILHRDLKSQNIFLKEGRLMLGDFGIAKVLDSTMDLAHTCIGTPYYMSPELFKNKPYSYKSDIWALGCVLYEMTTLKHAFDAQSLNGLACKILKGSYNQINPGYSQPLRELIKSMLSSNPQTRPSVDDLLRKPFLKRSLMEYVTPLCSPYNVPSPTRLKGHAVSSTDDLYMDSVKEQLERLKMGVMLSDIMDSNNNNKDSVSGSGSDPMLLRHSPSAEDKRIAQLKAEEEKKRKLEEALAKLEKESIWRAQNRQLRIDKERQQRNQQHQKLSNMERRQREKLEQANEKKRVYLEQLHNRRKAKLNHGNPKQSANNNPTSVSGGVRKSESDSRIPVAANENNNNNNININVNNNNKLSKGGPAAAVNGLPPSGQKPQITPDRDRDRDRREKEKERERIEKLAQEKERKREEEVAEVKNLEDWEGKRNEIKVKKQHVNQMKEARHKLETHLAEMEEEINKMKQQQQHKQQSQSQSQSQLQSQANQHMSRQPVQPAQAPVKRSPRESARRVVRSGSSGSIQSDPSSAVVSVTSVTKPVAVVDNESSNENADGSNLNPRERMMREKERRRKEEQERVERELREIRLKNVQDRKLAQVREQQLYQPSHHGLLLAEKQPIQQQQQQQQPDNDNDISSRDRFGRQRSSSEPLLIDNNNVVQEQEDEEDMNGHGQYDDQSNSNVDDSYHENDDSDNMEDQDESDGESDQESDLLATINQFKEDLQMTTLKIERLKTSLAMAAVKPKKIVQTGSQRGTPSPSVESIRKSSQQYSDKDEDLSVDEADQSTELPSESNSITDWQQNKSRVESDVESEQDEQMDEPIAAGTRHFGRLSDRVDAMRLRCIEGLGADVFQVAYNYLRRVQQAESSNQLYDDPDHVRVTLISIVGSDNIGYWSLLDQLIFMEENLDYANSAPASA